MIVDFDPTKPPYKKPKSPAESPDEQPKKIELREISPENLKDILEEHKKWLESEGREGNEANFDTFNLQDADLSKANLQNADLCWADLKNAELFETNLKKANLKYASLQGTDLRDANLQGANLTEANLQKASFNQTVLREANFQDADFTGATGLLANQFAGANVSGAKLPEDIAKFEGLGQVEKISQRAQKLFLSLLLGCVYCWLTIATTTDVELITNTGSSPLPIIQTKISMAYFYWAAPLILLSLYMWFHLYLQRLWERLSQLPAVFTDGETLDEKVFPWLISGMVRSHVSFLKNKRPALSRIQTVSSILLVWWLVPFTFLLFWLRYIPRHHWGGTSVHIGALAASITAAYMLYRLAAKTLCGENTFSVPWKEKWKNLSAYQSTLLTLGILGLCILIFFNISTGAIEGIRPLNSNYSLDDLTEPTYQLNPLKWNDETIILPRLVPGLFDYLGYRTYANIIDVDVSTKPSTWTGQKGKLEEEIPFVKGAKLNFVNLQNAQMQRAFLINSKLIMANLKGANLSGAQLQNAELADANLQDAEIVFAQLQNAKLGEANLQDADLSGANLQSADLSGANLQSADLSGAILQSADLSGANLQSADLSGAILQSADLRGVILQSADLRGVNLQSADLSDANLQDADIFTAQLQNAKLGEANLKDATLVGTDLQNTDFSGANLQGADLRGANLQSADLSGANLEDVDLLDANLEDADLSWARINIWILNDYQINEVCVKEFTELPENSPELKPCPDKDLSKK